MAAKIVKSEYVNKKIFNSIKTFFFILSFHSKKKCNFATELKNR